MQNERRAAVRAEAARLEQVFIDAGALRIEADSLLPAETLLDLYGEDIRARAYVTDDPVMGERMMRPDFTVPIVERHMSEGAEPARYTYNGPVWRMQDAGSTRATEFVQVGFEVFDRSNPAASDAEVFALFAETLPEHLTVTTGDVGLLQSAIKALKTSDRRRAALMRHLWRPTRFENLLAKFSQPTNDATRTAFLAQAEKTGVDAMLETAGKFIGLRSGTEIATRITDLQDDQSTPPISAEEVAVVNTLLSTDTTAAKALNELQELQGALPTMAKSVSVFARRLDALDQRGVDVNALAFKGRYGLTSMEYYDGFVFGFSDGETVVASGGRYDAMTAVLGEGREIPAVGGVIRPDALIGGTE
jgi:ATP phosphoribosyltransferase regulatory subunit